MCDMANNKITDGACANCDKEALKVISEFKIAAEELRKKIITNDISIVFRGKNKKL